MSRGDDDVKALKSVGVNASILLWLMNNLFYLSDGLWDVTNKIGMKRNKKENIL